MTASLDIAMVLAADDGDIFEIVIVLLFIGISVVGGLIKKAAERRQQQQRGRGPAPKPGAAAQQRQAAPQGQAAQTQTPRQHPPVRVAQPPQGRVVQLPPVRVVQLQSAGTPQADLSANVRGEVAAEQRRLQKEVLARHRRLDTPTPPEADSARIGKRLTRIRTQPEGKTYQAEQQRPQIVKLLSRNQARQAIIYHEIFSPPKALREGREMWDT